MKILGGYLKGQPISLLKDCLVRPTTDKLRSAIFSILGSCIENACVLDGFAGSGALGLEAISRGATFATFIDIDTTHVKKNCALLDQNKYFIKKGNFLFATFYNAPYDVIFLDPPYGLINNEAILKVIADNNILKNNGVIIYEEFHKTPFSTTQPFKIADTRKYGDTIIRFLTI